MTTNRAALIRALNDALRQRRGEGRIVLTQGIMSRGQEFVALTLTQLSNFDDFRQENDPWDEHDFGSFGIGGDQIFWKIDYYDLNLTGGADDPSDRHRCVRVLTVMLAQEY